MYKTARTAIVSRSARVGIVGLSPSVLRTTNDLINSGLNVFGFDSEIHDVADWKRLAEKMNGQPSAKSLQDLIDRGFTIVDQVERLADADVLLLNFATQLAPDLGSLFRAVDVLAKQLRIGQLLILEGWLYPGMTREMIGPILQKRGFKIGCDYFLACCPARRKQESPRVVGGLESRSLDLADEFWKHVPGQVLRATSLETAEACAVLENTLHDVKTAAMHELKLLFDRIDIDIWQVFELTRHGVLGRQVGEPESALEGSESANASYLSRIFHRHAVTPRLIDLAGEINSGKIQHVLDQVNDALNDRCKPMKGSKILVVGIVNAENSQHVLPPSVKLLNRLREKGATVSYHDPLVPELFQDTDSPLRSQLLTEESVAALDAVLVLVDCQGIDWAWVVRNSQLVIDAANATRKVDEYRNRVRRV